MSHEAVAHTRTTVRLGPAGRVALPFFLIGSLAGWATGGVGMLFPAFGCAVWCMSLWYGFRQSGGVRLRALDSPPHWSGQPFLFDLELSTEHRRNLRDLSLCLRTSHKGRAIKDRPVAFLSQISAGRSQVIPCGFRHLARGRQRTLSLALYSVFPLALLQIERHFELPVDLLAWPRLGHWRGPKPPSTQPGQAQRRQDKSRGHEEFYQLTPWRPGMPQRNIHWKLSARRGRLLQRELEGTSDGALTVGLLLATTEARAKRTRTGESFETAVALTATLVDHHLRAGRVVDLALYGAEHLKGLRGRTGRMAAMDALALIQSTGGSASDLAAAFHSALAQSPSQLVLALPIGNALLRAGGQRSTQLINVEDPTLDTFFRRALEPTVAAKKARGKTNLRVRS